VPHPFVFPEGCVFLFPFALYFRAYLGGIAKSSKLSLVHSLARGSETRDCHQIVTKTGAKQAKINELQKNRKSFYLTAGKGI
jgi:hypothetical protein